MMKSEAQVPFHGLSIGVRRFVKFYLPPIMISTYCIIVSLEIIHLFQPGKSINILIESGIRMTDLSSVQPPEMIKYTNASVYVQSLEAANEIISSNICKGNTPCYGETHSEHDALKTLETKYKMKFEKKERLIYIAQQQVTHIPWPGYFWAIQNDGFNFRYKSKMVGFRGDVSSPVEKYAKEFGVNSKSLADKVSLKTGLDHQLNTKSSAVCFNDGDCKSIWTTPSFCEFRNGRNWGVCTQTWCGYCTEWSAATILFPKEPRRQVQGKKALFSIMDQKALLTLILTGKSVNKLVWIGSKCIEPSPWNNLDQYGRMKTPACRDINPGSFHIMLMNIVGRKKQSFGK
jgi:hypothetical protein